ncbi:hypothetical protein [Frigoribacterium faeni]|nr:hypothetical protein [Frigoribacterium faeni]NIJ06173.1 hypothetical protein [Frigoribacterium faeni]
MIGARHVGAAVDLPAQPVGMATTAGGAAAYPDDRPPWATGQRRGGITER